MDLRFRAWDNKAKEWLLGYDVGELGGFSLCGECVLLGEWSNVIGRFIVSQKDRTPDDLVIMQWTGLHDQNGKLIYANDLVERRHPQGHMEVQKVCWDHVGWSPFIYSGGGEFEVVECVVIGNTLQPIKLVNMKVSFDDGDGHIDGEALQVWLEEYQNQWTPLGFRVEMSGDHIIATYIR